MKTTLKGRLRNTSLPASKPLIPLYEAIVNSIHSIDDAKNENGEITVKVFRDDQQEMDFENKGRTSLPDIVGFEIIDNGLGFNSENFEAFETLDSEHKIDIGGRGIGRLMWLKAFSHVEIASSFRENGQQWQRNIHFSEGGINSADPVVIVSSPLQTSVTLKSFKKAYKASCPKTLESLATNIIEHCLWFFTRSGSAPDIKLKDEFENNEILLNDMFDGKMLADSTTENCTIKGIPFELLHVRLNTGHTNHHTMNYCADNRVVQEEKISRLRSSLSDEHGKSFTYSCYIVSEFLDKNVRAERTGFDIHQENINGLFPEGLCFNDISETVNKKVSEHLAPYIDAIKVKAQKRVSEYVETRAPMYKPIMSRIKERVKDVDPEINDKDLDIILYKEYQNIELEMREKGAELDPKEGEEYSDYKKRMEEYFEQVQELKKSDLARYVCHRKSLLDFLQLILKKKDNGKYHPEELIHRTIFPMGECSDDLNIDDHDLWVIDEKLVFHHYLGSDKQLKMMPISDSDSAKEPDLLALNIFDNTCLFSNDSNQLEGSIVVVEFKRPMRNDYREGEDKNPLEQVSGYVRRLRAGNIKTKDGRPMRNNQNLPAYCYIICDIESKMEERCENFSLTRTADGQGYFGYNPNLSAYFEVISYDKLLADAKKRNEAFFRKLGLESSI